MNIGETFNPFKRFNGIFIPEQIVSLSTINQGAKLCYGRLLRFAGKNGYCFPSVKLLATELGVGERQTQKYLAELQDHGFIRKMPRPGSSDRIEFLLHEAFLVPNKGVKDSSLPGVKNTSQGVNDTSPQKCATVHPKRVREENHHQESHFEESQAGLRVSEDLVATPSQEGVDVVLEAPLSGPRELYDSPEAELIALAHSKGQELRGAVLRRICEDLELRGVTLARFVDAVRPHFHNNITNANGFLLSQARNVRGLLEPAIVPTPDPPAQDRCEACREPKGRGLIREGNEIVPCPKCATLEFRAEFALKEAERQKRIRRLRSAADVANEDRADPRGPS